MNTVSMHDMVNCDVEMSATKSRGNVGEFDSAAEW